MRIASVSVHTLYIPEEHLAADVVFFCLFGDNSCVNEILHQKKDIS